MPVLEELPDSENFCTATSTITVREAVTLMVQQKCGSVLILDNDELKGIFTERDLLKRVVGEDKPLTTAVNEVMTTTLCTISRTDTVQSAYEAMSNNNCRHVPVLDDGKVVALINMQIIMAWFAQKHKEEAELLKQYIQS